MKKVLSVVYFFTLLHGAQFEDNKRLCDDGNTIGCFNLGVMYVNGILGASKDEAKALMYFRKACNGGDIDGCLNAGKYFEEGEEVQQNYHISVEFYNKACDAGEAYACLLLGDIYRDGKKSIGEDSRRAAVYYKKVCDKGYDEGCKQYEKIRP